MQPALHIWCACCISAKILFKTLFRSNFKKTSQFTAKTKKIFDVIIKRSRNVSQTKVHLIILQFIFKLIFLSFSVPSFSKFINSNIIIFSLFYLFWEGYRMLADLSLLKQYTKVVQKLLGSSNSMCIKEQLLIFSWSKLIINRGKKLNLESKTSKLLRKQWLMQWSIVAPWECPCCRWRRPQKPDAQANGCEKVSPA